MKESKDHLDIDLEFLDKKDSVRVVPKPESNSGQTSSIPKSPSTDTKYNWKNILIIGGIVLFFGWAIFSGSSDSAPTYSTSGDEMLLTGGQYSCTQYHHDRAGELEPTLSQGNAIAAKTEQLSAEGDRLESEKSSIEYEYVDEYDQWSIDQHNDRIDSYNVKSDSYQSRVRSHQNDIDAYNARVATYNNYLTTNCRLGN